LVGNKQRSPNNEDRNENQDDFPTLFGRIQVHV
jgi:hypothetical protein